jgi:hypothetical protein
MNTGTGASQPGLELEEICIPEEIGLMLQAMRAMLGQMLRKRVKPVIGEAGWPPTTTVSEERGACGRCSHGS